MIKKEISEIKKLYGIEECTVDQIAGCYINADKEIISAFSEHFLNKEENEIFKYLDIFKQGLSGKIGKELNTLYFPIGEGNTIGENQNFLLKLHESGLKDNNLLNLFWDRAREAYPITENALFLLIHNVFDVPGRGNDQFKNMDASDEVYDYISFYICPVKLEDAGLAYDSVNKQFSCKDTRWCVQKPTYSFLFPSFEDRCSNADAITVYTKKTDGSMDSFTAEFLGIEPVISADEQKKIFQEVMEDAIKSSVSKIDSVQIMTSMVECLEEKKGCDSEPGSLKAEDFVSIAKESGMDENMISSLYDGIRKQFKEDPIQAENIINPKKIEFKTEDFIARVSADLAPRVKTDIVGNTKYLMIPLVTDAGLTIEGVNVGRKA